MASSSPPTTAAAPGFGVFLCHYSGCWCSASCSRFLRTAARLRASLGSPQRTRRRSCLPLCRLFTLSSSSARTSRTTTCATTRSSTATCRATSRGPSRRSRSRSGSTAVSSTARRSAPGRNPRHCPRLHPGGGPCGHPQVPVGHAPALRAHLWYERGHGCC